MDIGFFERYEKNGEYYIGKGSLIKGAVGDYYKLTLFNSEDFFESINDTKDDMGLFSKKFFSNSKEEHLVEILCGFLGAVGKNDFVKVGGSYICYKFKFDKDWFLEEYNKLKRLSETFYKYHGLKRITENIPEEFENLRWKKMKFPNESQQKALKKISEDQKEIIYSYYNGEKLSAEEKIFFNKISEEAKEGIKTFYFSNGLNTEETEKLNQFEKIWNIGGFEKEKFDPPLQNDKTRTEFCDAINDMMHNVRDVRSWNEGKKNFTVTQVPENCFGFFALFAVESLSTTKGFYNCESCGEADFYNHKSIKMCDRCKAAKRKRKSYIKQDILDGLSLEEIKIKRTRMEPEEIKELYKDAQKEIMQS